MNSAGEGINQYNVVSSQQYDFGLGEVLGKGSTGETVFIGAGYNSNVGAIATNSVTYSFFSAVKVSASATIEADDIITPLNEGEDELARQALYSEFGPPLSFDSVPAYNQASPVFTMPSNSPDGDITSAQSFLHPINFGTDLTTYVAPAMAYVLPPMPVAPPSGGSGSNQPDPSTPIYPTSPPSQPDPSTPIYPVAPDQPDPSTPIYSPAQPDPSTPIYSQSPPEPPAVSDPSPPDIPVTPISSRHYAALFVIWRLAHVFRPAFVVFIASGTRVFPTGFWLADSVHEVCELKGRARDRGVLAPSFR